jgi:hypothetical protein
MASGARELKALEQQLKQTQLKQKAGTHEFLFFLLTLQTSVKNLQLDKLTLDGFSYCLLL